MSDSGETPVKLPTTTSAVRISGGNLSQSDLRLSAGPGTQGDGHAGPSSAVIARTSQYTNLEEQYNLLKSKYISSMGKFATNIQLSNHYKQLEKKYVNVSKSVSDLTSANETLQKELSEAQEAVNIYKAQQLAEASVTASAQKQALQVRPMPSAVTSETYSHEENPLAASASSAAAAAAVQLAAPSYVSQEEYNEMMKARTAPIYLAPTQGPDAYSQSYDGAVRMCEVLDSLQKNNMELKEDIKGTLLEMTGSLQTTMIDFHDLRAKCEDMRTMLNQRELHLRDLIHTLEDRDRDIMKLQHALDTAEKHRTLREEEIQRFTTECEEVAQHNEEVMKEKNVLINKLKGENVDLKAELQIKGMELSELQEKIEELTGQLRKKDEENSSLLSRLNVIKTNAERLLLQRDGEIERLTEAVEKQKAEHKYSLEEKDEVITQLTADGERLRTELGHLAADKNAELNKVTADLANLRQTFTQSTKKKNEEATKLAQDIVEGKIEAAKALEEKEGVIVQLNTRIAELELEVRQLQQQREQGSAGALSVQRLRPLSAFSAQESTRDEGGSFRISNSVTGSSTGKLVVPIEYLVVNKNA